VENPIWRLGHLLGIPLLALDRVKDDCISATRRHEDTSIAVKMDKYLGTNASGNSVHSDNAPRSFYYEGNEGMISSDNTQLVLSWLFLFASMS
jgi:hypothetical protein